jgi:hypothetical protein
VNSFQDFSVFNSINPDTLTPKARKPLPFPLENVDASIAEIYANLDRLLKQFVAAESNPVNDSKAKKKRINSLKYKTKACMDMVKTINDQAQELWF